MVEHAHVHVTNLLSPQFMIFWIVQSIFISLVTLVTFVCDITPRSGSTFIFVRLSITGTRVTTLNTPLKSQTGFKLSIKSVQMASYEDDNLIIISNIVKRDTRSNNAVNLVMASLWRIQYSGSF